MKKQKFKMEYWYYIAFFIIAIIYIYSFFKNLDNTINNSDVAFLINRATQMINCLRDGNIPWFYYNDFFGVGYGSSFFYGQLTLYPFLPFLLISEKLFLGIYFIIALIIHFIGVYRLTKKITTNYKFITFLYFTSTFTFTLFCFIKMYACIMGISLSILFISFCIEFFRDKKSSIPASLIFFLILNTHLISALLSFIICVIIMIYYLEKNKIIDYIKFALVTIVLCSYFIINFIYHSNVIDNISEINRYIYTNTSISSYLNLANFPFGLLFNSLINTNFTGLYLFNLTLFGVSLFLFLKNFKKNKLRINLLLFLSIFIIILSTTKIWLWFNLNVFLTPIQFSFRFLPYILLFILIVLFSRFNNKYYKLMLGLVMLISLCILPSKFNYSNNLNMKANLIDTYIGNGEYLSSDFSYDFETFLDKINIIIDSNDNIYNYSENKGIISFNIETNKEIQVMIPKLYYNGYVAYCNNQKLQVNWGESQFLEINIPKDMSGTIYVYYNHPIWLIFLALFSLGFFVILIFNLIYVKLNKKNKI